MNSELLRNTDVGSDGQASTGPTAVSVQSLSKNFGRTQALRELNLTVPTGSVFALLGRNAAGKSTLMQILLGLLEGSSGSIKVLGLDPIKDGVKLKGKLGYIPERMPMYEWMTVTETLRFVAAQYPVWSKTVENELLTKLKLPTTQKVKNLSRGQRALLTLVLAMAHDPELVLLDECTSGMDALAREEFDRSVIDLLHDSGRTVLFASHQINELDRLCDWVGIIHEGRLLLQSRVDDLKSQVKTLQVTGQNPAVPGAKVLRRQTLGRDELLTVQALPTVFENLPPSVVDVIDLRLEQIFVAIVSHEEEGNS